MEKMEVDESAETEMENIKESEEKCSKNQGGKKAGKNPPPGIRQNYELHPIAPENDLLHQYYLGQGIISDEEWMAFAETLKIDLPSSFRIRLSLQERDHLVGYIESKFIKEISNIAESEDGLNSQLDPPKPVSFVPYAYQTKMSRQAIRSHPILKEFHEFLINETELGYISRQEVCSMIPPLLLEIEPHHFVLDACAAPGSKTMQILELMHKKPNPDGMLIANDIDYKRCYLLVHQTLKRIPSANCVVTSHDSAQFPTVFGPDQKPILFDRILCDLICSGDGTFRKNPELWRTWEPMKGINLHKLQLKIAQRCVELLKPGGMMCYSTCSLNPVEDEAIVAQILRTNEDKMELVDVSNKLPGLKRIPGINKWKVYNKNLKEYCSPEDVPQADRRHFKPSMFPPSKEECEKMHLERTFRILPHHQNTGGFFIAILRKKDSSDTDKGVKEPKPVATAFAGKPSAPKRRRFINKEDPFVFLEERNEDNGLREEMKLHFGICGFPYENLLVRSKNTERKKEIYFVNDRLRQFLKYNADRFKIVNAGMGVLKKITSDKVAPCSYRLKQDGLALLSPWISKRILNIPVELMTKILAGGTKQANGKEEHSQYVSMEEIGQHSVLFKELDPGSVVLCMHQPFNKQICAWIGANSVSAFVSREERFHLLSILGEDVQKFRRNADTTRQEKAKRIKGQTDVKNVVGSNEEEHSI